MNSAGDDQHATLHHDVVPLVDRRHDQPPDTGKREQRLHHDRAAEQHPELDPDHGHDRQGGVAEGVAEDDRPAGDALGAVEGDERGREHLLHCAPGRAQDVRRLGNAQGEDRQHHVAQVGQRILGERHVARWRQDAQDPGEQQHQHDPQPEVRDADRADDERARDPAPGPRPDRREDAQRDADDERERHRQDRELQGHRDALAQQLGQRGTAHVVPPEVTVEHARHPGQVLVDQGPVKAEVRPHGRDVLGRRPEAEHGRDRIAGDQADHQEHEDAHGDQHGDRHQQPAQDEGEAR